MRSRHSAFRILLSTFLTVYGVIAAQAVTLRADSLISPADTLKAETVRADSLKEVTVTGTRFLFVVKNDTTIYDLDALSLKEGALLRDAFSRLPGITFSNGKLYHNGREVMRVLINGVDFSRNNPQLALQALPAYIMKQIKVYNRKSDFAMMYGVEDGVEELVADVTVRRKYMGTWTGELAAGGGTDGRYVGRGYVNTFADRHRISIFGNANNINEQMWYNGDGGQRAGDSPAGDNRFYTPGVTFFWQTPQKLKEKGYFKIEGGADYNRELYDYRSSKETEQYLASRSLFTASDTREQLTRDRVAGHLKMDWRLTQKLSLNYLGTFDVYRSDQARSVLQANWNENPITNAVSIADALKTLQAAGSDQPQAIDLQDKQIGGESRKASYNHTLGLAYDLGAKTFLRFSHKMNLDYNDAQERNNTYYKFFNDEAQNSTRVDRFLDKDGHVSKHGIMARVMNFSKPEGFSYFSVYAQYDYDQSKTVSDERGYLSDGAGSVPQKTVDEETTRNWSVRTDQHTLQASLSAGKGIFYWELKPTFNYQTDRLTYTKGELSTLRPERSYSYFSGRSLLRIKSPRVGTLYVQYGLTGLVPDILSSVTYPDRADPQYIILGNDQLRRGTLHSLLSWYERRFTKETERGKITRTFYANLFFNHADNEVTNYTTYNTATGVVTVKQVNVSGNWDGKLSASFDTPLDPAQHFWFETYAEASVRRTRTFAVAENDAAPVANDNRLYAYALSVKPRAKFDCVDASLMYRLTFEDNQGSYFSVNHKEQWQHHLQGKLTGHLPANFTLNADANYHNYAGYLSGKRENWVMLDLEVERTFLREKNLFVCITAHDLLNRETGFQQQYSATALTRSYEKTLGRYLLLTLRYRFNTKKK